MINSLMIYILFNLFLNFKFQVQDLFKCIEFEYNEVNVIKLGQKQVEPNLSQVLYPLKFRWSKCPYSKSILC